MVTCIDPSAVLVGKITRTEHKVRLFGWALEGGTKIERLQNVKGLGDWAGLKVEPGLPPIFIDRLIIALGPDVMLGPNALRLTLRSMRDALTDKEFAPSRGRRTELPCKTDRFPLFLIAFKGNFCTTKSINISIKTYT
jgi:hypothetical protein